MTLILRQLSTYKTQVLLFVLIINAPTNRQENSQARKTTFQVGHLPKVVASDIEGLVERDKLEGGRVHSGVAVDKVGAEGDGLVEERAFELGLA